MTSPAGPWACPARSASKARRLTEPIPGGYTAFSDYEVNYTYANGVRHTVKTTRDDNIYGGVVNENGQRNGIKFEGSNGWIWVNRERNRGQRRRRCSPRPCPPARNALYVSNDHMGNFFDCVRSRKLPVADVETGHRSASLCHLGVIALRLGRKLQWNPAREKFTGEGAKEANSWLARENAQTFRLQFCWPRYDGYHGPRPAGKCALRRAQVIRQQRNGLPLGAVFVIADADIGGALHGAVDKGLAGVDIHGHHARLHASACIPAASGRHWSDRKARCDQILMISPETRMSGLPDVSRRKVPSCCNCLRREVLRYSVTRGSLGAD